MHIYSMFLERNRVQSMPKVKSRRNTERRARAAKEPTKRRGKCRMSAKEGTKVMLLIIHHFELIPNLESVWIVLL